MENKTYQHWQLSQDQQNIAWLKFDRQDASTNTIDNVVLTELDTILSALANAAPRGLIIFSGKAKGFIAGADVSYFSQFTTLEQIDAFLRQGQNVFDKIAALTFPTVAMIEGFCLGGGLELALACRYRIVEDSEDTRLGLPEVLLGIHPGWGGSARLPHLIGPLQALPLMLRGETVSAKTAAKIGLADAAVPKRELMRAAIYYINTSPVPHKLSWWLQLANKRPTRSLFAKYLRKQLVARVNRDHYPAPYAIIDNWEQAIESHSQALAAEINSITQLLTQNQTAKNLMRVFFLQERLKELAKQDNKIKFYRVHVIGAGVMGGDIAAWCAFSGFTVSLQDQDPARAAAALQRAHDLFKKKFKKDKRAIQAAMDRLVIDLPGQGIAKADVIIEAIVENLAAKQALFQDLERRAKPEAILATNTSSLPLDEINHVMENPVRLIGIHFFNPVAKMKLVEIVYGSKTQPQLIEQACAFVGKLNRLPLVVKSCPGFLVNRVLMPYLLEAITLFEEGVPAADIDKAAVRFGMMMGPVELADTVGLDVCLAVAQNLTHHYGGQVPQLLVDKVKQGDLGRKTGKGFYTYQHGKPVKVHATTNAQLTPAEYDKIANRLVLRLINESMACVKEKVVGDADLLDAGMVFGTGFAPFRGGPLHYADTLKKEA